MEICKICGYYFCNNSQGRWVWDAVSLHQESRSLIHPHHDTKPLRSSHSDLSGGITLVIIYWIRITFTFSSQINKNRKTIHSNTRQYFDSWSNDVDWGNEYLRIYSLIWVDCWNTGVCIEKETKMPGLHKTEAHQSVPARGRLTDVRQSVHLDTENKIVYWQWKPFLFIKNNGTLRSQKKQIQAPGSGCGRGLLSVGLS